MKLKHTIYQLFLAVIAVFSSCQTDVPFAGASALLEEDEIRVKSDTFAMASSLQKCAAISLTPDSFLLGECDTHFGTIKADILTQFACPVGYAYPAKAEVDSIVLWLYYQNWYGDGNAPLGITVYEMDRATLDYDSRYPSDAVLDSFCSQHDTTRIVDHSNIVFAADAADSVYYTDDVYLSAVPIKLSTTFAKRFFASNDFSSQEAFNQAFKGLYLASDFGGSTVLYVHYINMAVYYHFPLQQVDGTDSIVTDTKVFYANSEVRQINRYLYPDRDTVLTQLNQKSDTNYIISPANIYTQLSLRMDSIYQQITHQLGDTSDYRVYVNRANLTVDVLYEPSTSSRPRDEWDIPASHMLLIKAEQMESFFANNELPSDTSAILGTLTTDMDTVGNVNYSYSYDLSALLTQQLRQEQQVDELQFLLVPVAVETNPSSSTSILAVKPLQTISTTYIRSAGNSTDPMDLELVYSAFNKRH